MPYFKKYNYLNVFFYFCFYSSVFRKFYIIFGLYFVTMMSETFYGKLYKNGNSLVLTVPSNIIKFGGYNEGDAVKVMVQKQKDDFKTPEEKVELEKRKKNLEW